MCVIENPGGEKRDGGVTGKIFLRNNHGTFYKFDENFELINTQ